MSDRMTSNTDDISPMTPHPDSSQMGGLTELERAQKQMEREVIQNTQPVTQVQTPPSQITLPATYFPPPQPFHDPNTSAPLPQLSHASSFPAPSSSHGGRDFHFERFLISTKGTSLSSGFPFDERLYDLKVTRENWHQFTEELVAASKLSLGEDFAAWTAGITAGTLSSPLLLVFAPVVGFYTGKSIHKKTLQNKVKERLMQDGGIWSVLHKWNEGAFRDRGFHAWLELPADAEEAKKEVKANGTNKKSAKYAKKMAQRFRIMIIPNDGFDLPQKQASWLDNRGLTPLQIEPMRTPTVEAPGPELREPRELQNEEIQITTPPPPTYNQKYEYRPNAAPVHRESDLEDPSRPPYEMVGESSNARQS